MRTLTLFRHAKSDWTQTGPGKAPLADKERPLASRGLRDAPRMAAWLHGNNIRPDLIVCSTAVRTRQTLDLVKTAIATASTIIELSDDLYLAEAADIIERLQAVDDRYGHVMLIGHDPGIHEIALTLVGAGETTERQALAAKFPTAGVAVIEFAFRRWQRLAPGTGTLRLFMTPKRLSD
jgi:phosphohistidine phosphatase